MDKLHRIFFWLSLGAAILWLLMPNYLDTAHRSPQNRVKSDLRSIATAIESYYVDHRRYPDWSIESDSNVFTVASTARKSGEERVPTFRFRAEDGRSIAHLTDPTPYLTEYFHDPFAPDPRMTFAYWPHEFIYEGRLASNGWIAWSPGPDGDYDITIENVASLYDSTGRVPSIELLECCTYDPTNGSKSSGDIYRTKQ